MPILATAFAIEVVSPFGPDATTHIAESQIRNRGVKLASQAVLDMSSAHISQVADAQSPDPLHRMTGEGSVT